MLIEYYVDDTVFTVFSKNDKGINCAILTKNIDKRLRLDAEKFNKQYGRLKIIPFYKSHDRFLIIDNSQVYHIGSSLKDLGKKWFAFTKMDKESVTILNAISDLL